MEKVIAHAGLDVHMERVLSVSPARPLLGLALVTTHELKQEQTRNKHTPIDNAVSS